MKEMLFKFEEFYKTLQKHPKEIQTAKLQFLQGTIIFLQRTIISTVPFDRIWENNKKSTKLWGNNFQYMNKSQWKFQYRRLFHSWVINFRTTASINLSIFLCYFTDFKKTWNKQLKKHENISKYFWSLEQASVKISMP